jgi:MoxR-like ATPase
MNAEIHLVEARFANARENLERVRDGLNAVLHGQAPLIDDVLAAVFSGGHVLIEGLPGLGKTNLAKALAAVLDLELSRVQCTPDLMPADVTGSEVLIRGARGVEELEFRPGPVFSSLVLVDEINRATPKTQSALLEAMQEHQVTHAGRRHKLPEPFWVLATQNPIELEGTYPLPEAQLDRFALKLHVGYPSEESLLKLADTALDSEPAARVAPLLDRAELVRVMETAREVVIATTIKQAAVRLVTSTHPDQPGAHPLARQHFRYGASPRGLQTLLRVGRVRALLAGRAHVALDDLAAIAAPVLRHRVLLGIESELGGQDVDALLAEVISEWAGTH